MYIPPSLLCIYIYIYVSLSLSLYIYIYIYIYICTTIFRTISIMRVAAVPTTLCVHVVGREIREFLIFYNNILKKSLIHSVTAKTVTVFMLYNTT